MQRIREEQARQLGHSRANANSKGATGGAAPGDSADAAAGSSVVGRGGAPPFQIPPGAFPMPPSFMLPGDMSEEEVMREMSNPSNQAQLKEFLEKVMGMVNHHMR